MGEQHLSAPARPLLRLRDWLSAWEEAQPGLARVERHGEGQKLSLVDRERDDRLVVTLTSNDAAPGPVLETRLDALALVHEGEAALASAADFIAAWCCGWIWAQTQRVGERVVARELCARLPGARPRVLAREELERRWGDGLRGRTHARMHGGALSALGLQPPRPSPWAAWAGAADSVGAPKLERGEGDGGDGKAGGVHVPIDGELDLHNFSPKDVGRLLRAYIDSARERGQLELRVVHGKGKGVLRRTVHAELRKHAAVRDFQLAGPHAGGWGATQVRLNALDEAGLAPD